MFDVKPCSACAITNRALDFGDTSSASSLQWTPLKAVSKRLQRVTQWMSTVTSRLGSSRSCSHVRVRGCSTSPDTVKAQVARSTFGTEPAWRTGHFSVRYWPGGRRAASYPALRTLSSAFERKSGMGMHTKRVDVAEREREFVGVRGPDAADYLQRMVSNDVEALAA